MIEDIDAPNVAIDTIAILEYIDKSVFPKNGCRSYGHLYRTLHEVATQTVVGALAHRQLGWAQCAICTFTNTTYDLFDSINHKHMKRK